MSKSKITSKQDFHQACQDGNIKVVRECLSSSPGLSNSFCETLSDDSFMPSGSFPLHRAVLSENHGTRFQVISALVADGANPCCYDVKNVPRLNTDIAEEWPRISQRFERTGLTPLDLILTKTSKDQNLRIAELFCCISSDQAILLLEDARDLMLVNSRTTMAYFLTALTNEIVMTSALSVSGEKDSDKIKRLFDMIENVKKKATENMSVMSKEYDSTIEAEEQIKVIEDGSATAGSVLVIRGSVLREKLASAETAAPSKGGFGLRRSKSVTDDLSLVGSSDDASSGAGEPVARDKKTLSQVKKRATPDGGVEEEGRSATISRGPVASDEAPPSSSPKNPESTTRKEKKHVTFDASAKETDGGSKLRRVSSDEISR